MNENNKTRPDHIRNLFNWYPDGLSDFYTKDGRRLKLEELYSKERLQRHEEDPDYTRVALDGLEDCVISTVFLEIDHNFLKYRDSTKPGYKPILWETMVFYRTDIEDARYEDQYMERYDSEDKARKRHTKIVSEIQAYGSLAAWLEDNKDNGD